MPVAAIVGGALAAGGAIIASSNNSKAIKNASAAQAKANDQSVALQRDIYEQNRGALAPFMARGNAAGDQINALLGLGGGAGGYPALSDGGRMPAAYGYGVEEPAFASYAERGDFTFPGIISGYGGGTFDIQGNPVTVGTQGQPANPAQAANRAYEIFKQSTGYQTRFNEGMRALGSTFAGRGMSQSGAAIKSALRYGQDYASNEFGNYLGYLGNQQGVGLAGASALSGVGQNYANNITNLNSANAQFLGQAAVARANNSNQMWGGVLGGFGQALGGLNLSSYRAPAAATPSPFSIPATTPFWAPRGF